MYVYREGLPTTKRKLTAQSRYLMQRSPRSRCVAAIVFFCSGKKRRRAAASMEEQLDEPQLIKLRVGLQVSRAGRGGAPVYSLLSIACPRVRGCASPLPPAILMIARSCFISACSSSFFRCAGTCRFGRFFSR